jgi:hypothetical protein
MVRARDDLKRKLRRKESLEAAKDKAHGASRGYVAGQFTSPEGRKNRVYTASNPLVLLARVCRR